MQISTSEQKSAKSSALVQMGRKGLARALDWIYPPGCLACGRAVQAHPGLCSACWPQLRFITQPLCPVLGLPFEVDLGRGALSAEAIANPPDFDAARSAVVYGDVARQLVSRFKFGSQTEITSFLAQLMGQASADLFAVPAVLMPIPLHPRRQRARRFNQSGLLTAALSRVFARTASYDVLFRQRATRQQVGLSGRQRDENVRGAFRVDRERLSAIGVPDVILIDDVLTTGSTANAAARALKQAGVARVSVLTFARVTYAEGEAPVDFA